MLVDCLLAVASEGREGREYLREMGVYRVMQKMHTTEPIEAVRESIEVLVDLLERDEEKIREVIEEAKADVVEQEE